MLPSEIKEKQNVTAERHITCAQILTVILIYIIFKSSKQRHNSTALTRGGGWAESGQGPVLVHIERVPVYVSVSPGPPLQWICAPLRPLPHSE